MLGTLKITLVDDKYLTVCGGPYRDIPRDTTPAFVGVKMAAEINAPCQVSIPTRDFSTPPLPALNAGLKKAVTALLARRPLYVGCMGGKGRTGLFLAILAKTFGEENPVEYVRENYYPHAVETPDQYKFVMDYQVSPRIKKAIRLARIYAMFEDEQNLTKQTRQKTPKPADVFLSEGRGAHSDLRHLPDEWTEEQALFN